MSKRIGSLIATGVWPMRCGRYGRCETPGLRFHAVTPSRLPDP